MITVRTETAADIASIRRVEEAAFGRSAEADLVDALRRRGRVTLSLVAVEDGIVTGHILFTPVTFEGLDGCAVKIEVAGLGPLAVLPASQRRGVGSRLVKAGLEACRSLGIDAVVVLGHAGYYPRFGFQPAGPLGIRWEVDGHEASFFVAELRQGALNGLRGVIRYAPELTGL